MAGAGDGNDVRGPVGPGYQGAPALRRPVALGCTALVAIATLGVFTVIFLAAFCESGADTGQLVLEPSRAYLPGTATYVNQRNFYLVKLGQSEYYALADLDAANRANGVRRCRAVPVASSDPALPELVERYRRRLSPAAAGSTLLFREVCNHAIYDVTGTRLDADAANLDRYPVSVRGDGRVVVDLSRRQCSAREAGALAVERAC